VKRAWILGGHGFLGRHAGRLFAKSGWTVGGLGHAAQDESALELRKPAAWLEADISHEALCRLAETTELPDVIFHAGGSGAVGPSFSDPLRDFQRSVATTAELLDFVRRHVPAATVILPSSAAVYGAAPPGPLREDIAPHPVSPYGTHKLMAEELCRAAHRDFGLRCIVIRYFSLYGPGQRKQLLWDLLRKVAADPGRIELFGTGDETRDMFYVDDAVRLALHMVESAARFVIVNGGTGQPTTIRALAEATVAALKLPTRVLFNGVSRPGDPQHYQADTGLARSYGYLPGWTLEEGLAEYAQWAQTAMPLPGAVAVPRL
jgi:UDP-glucose 4-epimerase